MAASRSLAGRSLPLALTLALLLALTGVLLLGGCGGADDAGGSGDDDGSAGSGGSASGQRYPDVESAELVPADDGRYDVSVTISSPYDSPERYADGWRVLDPDGDVLGEHELLHDHAGEQPFTRTQTGLEVPDDVDVVTVEGRDLENGYGGDTVDVDVP